MIRSHASRSDQTSTASPHASEALRQRPSNGRRAVQMRERLVTDQHDVEGLGPHWQRPEVGKSSTTEIPFDKRAHTCGPSAFFNRDEYLTNPGLSVISPGNRRSKNSS